MISITGSLWPYLLVSAFWVVVCGYFLHRAWKLRDRSPASADGFALRPERRSIHRMQDTQAGRI
jgi:hypothetical protein